MSSYQIRDVHGGGAVTVSPYAVVLMCVAVASGCGLKYEATAHAVRTAKDSRSRYQLVTELLEKLQSSGRLTDVKLSNLERTVGLSRDELRERKPLLLAFGVELELEFVVLVYDVEEVHKSIVLSFDKTEHTLRDWHILDMPEEADLERPF